MAGDTALGWSVAAMADSVQRLRLARSLDLPQAIAVISEAVWWVTIVDATIVRYHVPSMTMPWRAWILLRGGRWRERSAG